ncbi:NAD(P)-binding protein [Microthyrium microscopicum]|uniref:NAD(P)-binding protein n=1 Tax=Microthyrium microscopicum TaxID=703497 RepID=A0A6A6TZB8_9PEZI|nr:NAD(P)-binding protein [Microthyrium microscopicum]
MVAYKKTVLITGCSDGGLGAGLAIAFHKAGLHVYATARNPNKMTELAAMGIETRTLDVLNDESIAACVKDIPSLDILVNNAGGGYFMPASDLSIPEAKKLFDLNVWSYLAVTQAFLPLLIKSKGLLVNQTSISSVSTVPFTSAYSASKAAMATFSDGLRLELAPFGIRVVELKTGAVQSNFMPNLPEASVKLPQGSIYEPARDNVETIMSGQQFLEDATPLDKWSSQVVHELLKPTPPKSVWKGKDAWLVWLVGCIPFGPALAEGLVKKRFGMDVIEQKVRK